MPVASILQMLRRCRERHRQRNELAVLLELGSDVRDLGMEPELIRNETNRWPWQAWSGFWRAAAEDRRQLLDSLDTVKTRQVVILVDRDGPVRLIDGALGTRCLDPGQFHAWPDPPRRPAA